MSVKDSISTVVKRLAGIVSGDAESNEGMELVTGRMFVVKGRSGESMWIGVHTNKYIDDDLPPDILSEAAHKDFIDRVYKGEVPMPELWFWHIDYKIGDTKLLAWDDSGFMISVGTFVSEDWADALASSKVSLAMSHGMENIERDREKSFVITKYTTYEVSVLPEWMAANKYTGFDVSRKSVKMIDKDQREAMVLAIGEERVSEIEDALSKAGDKAIKDGRIFKSSDIASEEKEAMEEEEEVVAEEGAEEEKVDSAVTADVAAESSDVIEAALDSGAEELTDEEEPEPDDSGVGALSEEISALSGAFVQFTELVTQAIQNLAESQKQVSEKQEELAKTVKELSAANASAVSASRSKTVHGAMEEFMKVAQNSSVVGSKSAKVSGDLAAAKPKETEEGSVAKDSLFINQWLAPQRAG